MTRTKIIAEPGSPQILTSREFDAPRELLFRAHTDPALLVQWLGPRRLSMTVEQLEVRHGGVWRYLNREADGTEYAFRGVFHGTPSLDGIVHTFEFEGMPGHVTLETTNFEDLGGRTLLRQNTVFQSVADRDAMVESGMEDGMTESFDRLDELLATLQSASR